ncbi:hypothetical protein MPLB_940011 [Mesorhizobium sp. ORS 3324]|nr:hypothetical protein MPLB_940011 [Mesorhizobium sp. ORS 3324]
MAECLNPHMKSPPQGGRIGDGLLLGHLSAGGPEGVATAYPENGGTSLRFLKIYGMGLSNT